jgi:hypothetical protein
MYLEKLKSQVIWNEGKYHPTKEQIKATQSLVHASWPKSVVGATWPQAAFQATITKLSW